MRAAAAVQPISKRQQFHREKLARLSLVRDWTKELRRMRVARFFNLTTAGRLYPAPLDTSRYIGVDLPKATMLIVQLVAAVSAFPAEEDEGGGLDDEGKPLKCNAVEVTWPVLVALTGASFSTIAERAIPRAVAEGLLQCEYNYAGEGAYRRDGSVGKHSMRGCTLTLGPTTDAMLKHQGAIRAAWSARGALERAEGRAQMRARRAAERQKKREAAAALLGPDYPEPKAVDSSLCSESTQTCGGAPATPARSTVHAAAPPSAAVKAATRALEELRRARPLELLPLARQTPRPPQGGRQRPRRGRDAVASPPSPIACAIAPQRPAVTRSDARPPSVGAPPSPASPDAAQCENDDAESRRLIELLKASLQTGGGAGSALASSPCPPCTPGGDS